MARAQPFPGYNRLFEMPPVQEGDPLSPMLPMAGFTNGVLTYTCWKLSPEELAEVNRTGEVWMAARTGGRAMQPHWVGSLSFIKWACAEMGKMWKAPKDPPAQLEHNPA